jgi:peptidoglycan/LPS O-acetylase OafA/YrhL
MCDTHRDPSAAPPLLASSGSPAPSTTTGSAAASSPLASLAGTLQRPVGVATSSPYLPELESLRGVAMLLVLLFHIDAFLRIPYASTKFVAVSPWLAFLRAGHTGVSLFFVLSAFLLSLPLFTAAASRRRLSLRRYAVRRALRILPLYYTAVVVAIVVSAKSVGDAVAELPYFLFLNFLAPPLLPYSSVWWSLFTEVQFYLLLPLLWFCLHQRVARWCTAALLVGYGVAYGAFVLGRFHMPSFDATAWLGLSLFGRAPLFLAGIAAAGWYAHYGDGTARRCAAIPWLRRGGADVLFWGVVLSLATVLQWVAFVGLTVADSPPRVAWHIVEGAQWSVVLLLILIAPLRSKPLLCNRWLGTLGVLSYSVYIVHVPLVRGSLSALRDAGITGLHDWSARTGVVAVALVAACIGSSVLTYRFIERPFLVRKDTVRG